MIEGLNNLAKKIHEGNKKKGFYDEDRNTGEILCLIHSEISEALEADRADRYCNSDMITLNGWKQDHNFLMEYRDKVKGTFEEEMADAVIRLLDTCAYKGIDLEAHLKAKIRYNSTRKYKHGKKY